MSIVRRIEIKRQQDYDEREHPRDRLGRFIESGSSVRLRGGGMATVLGPASNGRILVRRTDTGKHVAVDKGSITVTARPNGGQPTSKPEDNPASINAAPETPSVDELAVPRPDNAGDGSTGRGRVNIGEIEIGDRVQHQGQVHQVTDVEHRGDVDAPVLILHTTTNGADHQRISSTEFAFVEHVGREAERVEDDIDVTKDTSELTDSEVDTLLARAQRAGEASVVEYLTAEQYRRRDAATADLRGRLDDEPAPEPDPAPAPTVEAPTVRELFEDRQLVEGRLAAMADAAEVPGGFGYTVDELIEQYEDNVRDDLIRHPGKDVFIGVPGYTEVRVPGRLARDILGMPPVAKAGPRYDGDIQDALDRGDISVRRADAVQAQRAAGVPGPPPEQQSTAYDADVQEAVDRGAISVRRAERIQSDRAATPNRPETAPVDYTPPPYEDITTPGGYKAGARVEMYTTHWTYENGQGRGTPMWKKGTVEGVRSTPSGVFDVRVVFDDGTADTTYTGKRGGGTNLRLLTEYAPGVYPVKATAKEVSALWRQLDEQGVDDMHPIRGVINRRYGNQLFIARGDDGKITGAIQGTVDGRGNGRSVHITQMRVMSDEQGKGTGRDLIVAAAREVGPGGQLSVGGAVETAKGFYARTGAVFDNPYSNHATWSPASVQAMQNGQRPEPGEVVSMWEYRRREAADLLARYPESYRENYGDRRPEEVPDPSLPGAPPPPPPVDDGTPAVPESAADVATGQPVTLPWIRRFQDTGNFGTRYGQDVEPAGRYLSVREADQEIPDGNVGTGVATFDNPLVLEFGGGYEDDDNWKRKLSAQYGGKTGRALSQAVRNDGHDVIITRDKYGFSEVVDLTGFDPKTPRRAKPKASRREVLERATAREVKKVLKGMETSPAPSASPQNPEETVEDYFRTPDGTWEAWMAWDDSYAEASYLRPVNDPEGAIVFEDGADFERFVNLVGLVAATPPSQEDLDRRPTAMDVPLFDLKSHRDAGGAVMAPSPTVKRRLGLVVIEGKSYVRAVEAPPQRTEVKARRTGAFKESDHPRDRRGRFVEVGGTVSIFGGGQGTVLRSVGGGRIEIQKTDGRKVTMDAGQTTMIRSARANLGRTGVSTADENGNTAADRAAARQEFNSPFNSSDDEDSPEQQRQIMERAAEGIAEVEAQNPANQVTKQNADRRQAAMEMMSERQLRQLVGSGKATPPQLNAARDRLEVLANEKADQLLKRYAKVEPAITEQLQATADENGARMEGLEFRVKGKESLARKLRDKSAAKGLTMDEYGEQIGDAIRYTMIAPPESYSETVQGTLDDFRDRGYEVIDDDNTWVPDSIYKGINSVLRTPDGTLFELQFHTEDSFRVKMGQHVDYERYRDPAVPVVEQIAAYERMRRNWEDVEVPPGVESVGTLLQRPAPFDEGQLQEVRERSTAAPVQTGRRQPGSRTERAAPRRRRPAPGERGGGVDAVQLAGVI